MKQCTLRLMLLSDNNYYDLFVDNMFIIMIFNTHFCPLDHHLNGVNPRGYPQKSRQKLVNRPCHELLRVHDRQAAGVRPWSLKQTLGNVTRGCQATRLLCYASQ